MSPENNPDSTPEISLIEDICHAASIEEACPYLPGRDSNLKFLYGDNLGLLYRIMMDEGYRRYGRYIYRTNCDSCSECRVIRIPVHDFNISHSQKRIWKKGRSVFSYRIASPERTDEKECLYKKYLENQHGTIQKSDDASDTGSNYELFFTETFLPENTRELQLYYNEKLCGVGILDLLNDALSSVYFFFDPDIAAFSPGTYSILLEIEIARERGMKYYYPGFYIEGAKTMSYKSNFKPCHIRDRISGAWTLFTAEARK